MDFEDAFFDTEDFKLTDKMLGEGGFGKVFVVERKADKKKFAAKIIDPKGMLQGTDQIKFLRESQILHKLKHPYVVKFHGINFHSFKETSKLEPTILTEYVPNGSLDDVLTKERKDGEEFDKKWNSTKKYICLLGIVDAMRYLHSNHVIHRDLKPSNVLMDENYFPRICDFGISRCFSNELSNSIQMSLTGFAGTPLYMAPEVLQGDTLYGNSIDVYSFAFIAYEIVTGLSVFDHFKKSTNLFQMVSKTIAGERPKFNDKPTEKMIDLIKKCWSSNSYERPSFAEIFHLLSTDFSYFPTEELNYGEINDFLSNLKASSEYKITGANEKISGLLFDTTRLEKKEKLGEGLVGVFYRSILPSKDGQPPAVYTYKILKDLSELDDQKEFFNTIQLQSSLKHPAILKLAGFSVPNKNDKFFSMITEFPKNGSLDKMINGSQPKDWPTIRSIVIFGVAAAMAFIHQQGIVLNDLRTESIFLDEKTNPKIGGFVNAFFLDQGELCTDDISKWPIPIYLAPELIHTFLDHYKLPFGHKVDVYAYAIVLFQLLTKRKAYNKKVTADLLDSIANGLRPTIKKNEIPDCYVELLKSCWDQNPDARPSFMKIVQMFLKEKEKYFDLKAIDNERFDKYIESVTKDLSFW